MADAFTTADTLLHDLARKENGSQSPLQAPERSSGLGWDGVKTEVASLGLRTTSWQDWQRIDAAERERGQLKGKIRDKFGRVEEMLEVLE
jgi:adrenodoxin-NADP+ reductase